MTGKKFVLAGFLGLGVLLGAAGYLGFRILLPVNPKDAYFPAKETRLGVVHWTFANFQPVYLGCRVDQDKQVLIKTMFRSADNKIKKLEVWTGGEDKEIKSCSEISKKVKNGQRINIRYIRNVVIRPEGGLYADVITPGKNGDSRVQVLCTKSAILCELAEYTMTNSEAYWNFRTSGEMPVGVSLKAYAIDSKLAEDTNI